jgi:hypothetical protein
LFSNPRILTAAIRIFLLFLFKIKEREGEEREMGKDTEMTKDLF